MPVRRAKETDSLQTLENSPYIYVGNKSTSEQFLSYEAKWLSSFKYNYTGGAGSDQLFIRWPLRNITCDVYDSELAIEVRYINGEAT